MLQVRPIQVILGLVYDLGSEVTVSNGFVHQPATEYFLDRGHGQELFTKEQIRQMMAELGIVMGLHNINNTGKMDYNHYRQWSRLRESYYRVWEKKWKGKMKPRPKL
jgi:hypothetical protein